MYIVIRVLSRPRTLVNSRVYCLYYAEGIVGWFYHFTVVLVSTNVCINPFIYAAKYHEFKKAIKGLFCKQSQRELQQQATA